MSRRYLNPRELREWRRAHDRPHMHRQVEMRCAECGETYHEVVGDAPQMAGPANGRLATFCAACPRCGAIRRVDEDWTPAKEVFGE